MDKKLIIIVAALTQFTATFAGTMVSIALPDIYNEFNISMHLLNWITIAFLTVFMAVTIPLGKIISNYGLKRVTVINNVLFIVGLLISICSTDVYMLIFSRIVQAVAVAGLSISVFMMVTHEIPKKEVGQALGLVGSAGYIGLTSAPSVTGFIVHYLSWRHIFIFTIMLTFIQLILLLRVKKEWKSEKQSVDVVGTILYMASMVLFTYGLTMITENGIYTIILSLILFAILMRLDKSKENPVINVKLLKNIEYFTGVYAAMTTYFITFIATYILNLYLQMQLNFEPHTAGLILVITPAVMVFVSPLSGRLSIKYDARSLSAIALTFLLITMILLSLMRIIPFYLIIIGIIIQGIGHGLFSAPNNKYTLTLFDTDYLGDATSILATSKEFGKNLSLSIYTVICVLFVSNIENMEHFDMSFDIMFSISILVTISAIILLLYTKFRYEESVDLNSLNFLRSVIRRK